MRKPLFNYPKYYNTAYDFFIGKNLDFRFFKINFICYVYENNNSLTFVDIF